MKAPYRRFSLLLCIIMVLTLFSGCSKHNKNAVIYYETEVLPATIDPQLASNETELMLVRNLFEGLMRVDSNGEIVCGLAESYTFKDNTYTFYLSESAKWSDGSEVTAYDFVFAFKRAVDPKTKAPYASKLSSILNADLILSGMVDPKELGVKAEDSTKLVINMAYNDTNFLRKLTTSICMPCNEEFFNDCKGSYGLSKDNILTNGSYKLTKWNREDFAVRMHKSENYLGKFTAKNAAVFMSSNPNKRRIDMLSKSSVDIAYISPEDLNTANSKGLITAQTDNIVWIMKFSNAFSYDLKHSLIAAIDRSLYAGNLGIGFNVAYTLFPSSISPTDLEHIGMEPYDINLAKSLFQIAIKEFTNNRLPSTTLIYYDDPSITRPLNDIVGHWQNNLGAYINLRASKSISEIENCLKNNSYYIAVYPIYLTDNDTTAYVKQLGYDFTESELKNLSNVQSRILSDYSVIPLAIQNSVLAYSPKLTKFFHSLGNGTIDFAYIQKEK